MFAGRSIYWTFFIMKIAVVITADTSGDHKEKEEEQHDRPNMTSCNDICLTPACVNAASNILKSIDLSIDPCEDFYQFACKKFIENTRIPDDESAVSVFSGLIDKVNEQLREVLELPVTEHDIRPFKLAKYYYQACMNTSSMEVIGTSHVKNLLTKVGGWPVLEGDDWNENSFDWKESVYASSRIGLPTNYLFSLSRKTDYTNSSIYRINLNQPHLGLARSNLIKGLDDKVVSEYYKYMIDIAELFGADRIRATEELKQSVEFEISLANITVPADKLRDSNLLNNRMTITELENKYPSIPWLTYINSLVPNQTIESEEVILNLVPSFIENVEILLRTTPKRILANYLLGRIANAAAPFLSNVFKKRLTQFKKFTTGTTEEKPRWKTCVATSKTNLDLAVAAMYVRKFFNEETKREALDMVNNIRSQVYKILENVDWMDDETRAAALTKAKSMTNHIAYPSELLDDSKLETFYKDLEIDPHDLFGSSLNIKKLHRNYIWGLLPKPINKTNWVYHSLVAQVNAKYMRSENALMFSAAILQGHFFNKDIPRYLNYGGIGVFAGHEITHGFDDQGRQFDKDGNLIDWWKEETKKKYLERAACIVEQYGNYTAESINTKLNGVLTQGENIADNGGFKEAYQAYISWMQENTQEQRLPGLEIYSPQQMFWIGAATSWCRVTRPEFLRNSINTDAHAPHEFRIKGSFSNLEEFSRDFKCPVGSKMNPVHKCTVW